MGLLAQNARDLIFRYRFIPTPGFEYVSPSSTAITGYTPEEHYADPLLGYKLVHPDDRNLLEASTRSPESPLVLRWRRKDGAVIWTEQRNKPIYDESGKLVALEGIARDVTEHKEAEEALKESEECLRLALEAASLGLWYQDLDTGEFVASPGASAMHGLPPGTPLDPQKALDVVHPGDRDHVRERVGRAIAERGPYEAEFRVVRPDGSVRWVSSRGRAYERLGDGRGGRLIGVVQDITERKKAEEERLRLLRREQTARVEAQEAQRGKEEYLALLDTMLETAPVGFAFLDRDLRFVRVNDSLAAMNGIPAREHIGRALGEVLPELNRSVGPFFRRVLETGEPVLNVEVSGASAATPGQARHWLAGYYPVRTRDGASLGVGCVVLEITSRKEAEEALKESEERFRAAFGSAAIGMSLTATDGRYMQVNPRMCEITGYSEEELVGTDFRSITHPDDLQKDLEGFNCLLSGEIRYYYSEKRYVHKMGHPVWVLLSSSVVRDARGEPLYFVTQVQDITGSKKDKEDLERLSHQNELILASAGEGIYGLDLAERTTFVNPAAEQMLGYEPGELTGRHQHDIIRHLHADGVPYPEDDCPVYAALRDGEVHASSDEVFRRKDGTSFPVEYVSTPIRHDGEVVGAVVTFRDITERRRAEEALKENASRFRLLAEKTSDLICLHEPDGRYVYVSPSSWRLLGYEPEELLGTDPYELFHPEDVQRIRSASHDRALEGQGAVSVTYRIRRKSGGYTWFETLTEPIVDERGNVVRLQTSSRDVSDRKRAEEALAEAARAKTEFLAEVSHELRTPLTVIQGNAEVGLELGRGCAHEQVLEEIVKESATMSRMVEDLLFLVRSDSLSPPFELQPVAVEPFLAGLAKGAEALAQERGAPLEADLLGSGWVEMDPTRVKQAVLALVDNAAKYGAPGERVSLRSATPNGELRIQVEDRGPGIPEEHLPRVFERFYRVEDTGEPGNGLGLSIAKSIAEAHGGRIEATSRPGEGTKMSLCVPLLTPNGDDPTR
jgi:PAS domain S-box-containing protein